MMTIKSGCKSNITGVHDITHPRRCPIEFFKRCILLNAGQRPATLCQPTVPKSIPIPPAFPAPIASFPHYSITPLLQYSSTPFVIAPLLQPPDHLHIPLFHYSIFPFTIPPFLQHFLPQCHSNVKIFQQPKYLLIFKLIFHLFAALNFG